MDLIIEAGGSKTSFYFEKDGELCTITKEGFNPSSHSLAQFNLLLSSLSAQEYNAVFYYGAGVTNKKICEDLHDAVLQILHPQHIEIHNDLIGAARACFGNQEGIISILGTGSATAWYENGLLDQRVPSGGYLIGDVGSGFELGRRIAFLWITGQLDQTLSGDLEYFCGASSLQFRNKIYSSTQPVKDIAALAQWARSHTDEPVIQKVIHEHFQVFAQTHLEKYTKEERNKMAFCGGIAFYFKEEIIKAIKPWIYNDPKFLKEAGTGLCSFHFNTDQIPLEEK